LRGIEVAVIHRMAHFGLSDSLVALIAGRELLFAELVPSHDPSIANGVEKAERKDFNIKRTIKARLRRSTRSG
jgi:hypothetical protein